jgi:hypothetical protein
MNLLLVTPGPGEMDMPILRHVVMRDLREIIELLEW